MLEVLVEVSQHLKCRIPLQPKKYSMHARRVDARPHITYTQHSTYRSDESDRSKGPAVTDAHLTVVVPRNTKGLGQAAHIVTGKIIEKGSRDFDFPGRLRVGFGDAGLNGFDKEFGHVGLRQRVSGLIVVVVHNNMSKNIQSERSKIVVDDPYMHTTTPLSS